MLSTLCAGMVGLIALTLSVLLGFAIHRLLKEDQAMTDDLIELFELRERMSNAAYQGSVQRSLCLLKANSPPPQ